MLNCQFLKWNIPSFNLDILTIANKFSSLTHIYADRQTNISTEVYSFMFWPTQYDFFSNTFQLNMLTLIYSNSSGPKRIQNDINIH